MRVSSRVMYEGLSDRLAAQASRLVDLQNRITTGRRLLRPSDDPAGAGRATALDSRLADLAQYASNASMAKATLSATEGAVATVVASFREARRLALTGANDTTTETERRVMASQVDRLLGQVQQAAETRYAGRYLFSGTDTQTSPLAPTGVSGSPFSYAGDDGQRLVQIADRVNLSMSVSGRAVFNFGGAGVAAAPDAFAALAQIRDDLIEGDTQGLSGILDDMDSLLDNFNRHRGEIGQAIQRVEFNDQYLGEQQEVVGELRAGIVDVDFAAAVTEYTTRQTVYQATLALTARMDQPSLFEFLRG